MGFKAIIFFYHFVDLFITGGLIFTFVSTIGDWQAGISLCLLLMFAFLRGKLMLEDISNKREDRRRKEIENNEKQFDLDIKKGKYVKK